MVAGHLPSAIGIAGRIAAASSELAPPNVIDFRCNGERPSRIPGLAKLVLIQMADPPSSAISNRNPPRKIGTYRCVLVPITGVRHPDNSGVIRVRNGQRRTLAAREVGLATVPVFVLASSAADASEETIERIVHQIVTNDQKHDLTDAQRARGIQQLLDAGVSVTRVAKFTGLVETRALLPLDSSAKIRAYTGSTGSRSAGAATYHSCSRG